MSTEWIPLHIAREIDDRVHKLRERGCDDMAILTAMVDDIPRFQRLRRIAGRPIMNELFGRFPGLHRYAIILENLAKDMHSGQTGVPGDGMGGRKRKRKTTNACPKTSSI